MVNIMANLKTHDEKRECHNIEYAKVDFRPNVIGLKHYIILIEIIKPLNR